MIPRRQNAFLKKRGIKYQFIDMKEKGMSKGELTSVASANGGKSGNEGDFHATRTTY